MDEKAKLQLQDIGEFGGIKRGKRRGGMGVTHFYLECLIS